MLQSAAEKPPGRTKPKSSSLTHPSRRCISSAASARGTLLSLTPLSYTLPSGVSLKQHGSSVALAHTSHLPTDALATGVSAPPYASARYARIAPLSKSSTPSTSRSAGTASAQQQGRRVSASPASPRGAAPRSLLACLVRAPPVRTLAHRVRVPLGVGRRHLKVRAQLVQVPAHQRRSRALRAVQRARARGAPPGPRGTGRACPLAEAAQGWQQHTRGGAQPQPGTHASRRAAFWLQRRRARARRAHCWLARG